MDERQATTTDTLLHLAAQYNPNEFIDVEAGRTVRARVMFKQTGPVLQYPWTSKIDFAGWEVAE